MKKNIWVAFFLMLVFMLPATGAVAQIDTSSPEYLNILNQSIMRPGMDVILKWMEQAKTSPKTYIDPKIKNILSEKRFQNAPTQINLLNHLDYIPSERDQSSCGNCWNWAGQGVLGIALDVNRGIKDRLSIQFLNSCKSDRYACCGGWLDDFANWYAEQGITVPWSNTNAFFSDGSTPCQNNQSSITCSSVATNPNYEISSIETTTIETTGSQSQAIENIKNVLAQNKAIWFGFFLPNQEDWNQFMNFWRNQSEEDLWSFDFSQGHEWTSNGGGHAVLLVGYNEDTPEPYWIVLNSWGTTAGRPNGLFRMKMDMNYSLFHYDTSRQEQGLYFQTLNVQFGGENPGECTYSIFPTEETVDAGGGNSSFAVYTSSNACNWSVSTSADWIKDISPSGGTGSSTVTYSVAPNSGTEERQGTITVQGRTLTIKQRGRITESNVLQNPGFEDGMSNTAWVQDGYYEILYNAPCFTFGAAECAHGGTWEAWLGGYDNAKDLLYQYVTIPATAVEATLRFWYAIETWEYPDDHYDFLGVLIYNGEWHEVFQLSNMNWTNDWVQSPKIDLSAFIGQTVAIAFFAMSDNYLWTNFYIDDVALQSGSHFQPAAPIPDIKANGGDGPISVPHGTPVSIAIRLNTGSFYGQNADWWIAQSTPQGTFEYFDLLYGSMLPGLFPTYMGPLFNMGSVQILNTNDLAQGTHNFYFAVDMNKNGSLDMNDIYVDGVKVNVTQP